MKNIFILLLVSLLAACASNTSQKTSGADAQESQKIKITGKRIKKSDLPSGPKLSMKLNQQNKDANFMAALAGMESLPKPKHIGDCKGLLSALSTTNQDYEIVDANKAVLETKHGIYEYTFDDNSCPLNKS